jgi:hypothetical protein
MEKELQEAYDFIFSSSRLDDVMVSVLAIGPKVRGLKPGRGDEFLRAIKIRSTPSFGVEVKLSAKCHKIYDRNNHLQV